MSRSLGLSVAAGLTSGLVYLSVLSGGLLGVMLSYLTPLPLVMIGLAMGLVPAAIAALIALAVVALAAPLVAVPVFAVVALLPVLVLVRQALLWRPGAGGAGEWYPPGRLLAQLALLAVALMGLGAALAVERTTGLEEVVHQTVGSFVDQVAPTAPADMKDSLTSLWSALFPAMLAGAWLLTAVLNGMVGEWTVAKAGHAQRPVPDYAALELPLWLLGALAVTALIGGVAGGDAGYLGRNAAVVLLWPYVFAGLATVHRWSRGRPNAGLLLALFYLAFFAMFGWALVAVAGLGLVRHWTRLRRRDAAGGQEEK